MNAGRELDALVAEKVIRETDYEHGEIGEDSSGDPYCSRCRMSGDWGDRIFSDERCIPAYSTSIAAAWTVVEKLKQEGWLLRLNDCGRGRPSGYWVFFYQQDTGENPYGEVASGVVDTAPLAICLAALKSVNVEVPS